jgi:Tfp pilus assembly protein PilF
MTLLYEQPTAEPLTPEQQLEQDIALVLQTALQHHHQAEFNDAETLYRTILEAKPHHADVLYNLGVLLGQTSRTADAVPLFERNTGQPTLARSSILAKSLPPGSRWKWVSSKG